MRPPASASGAGEPSRSAIVGVTVTGHHLLEIDGYSHTKEIPTGQCIGSRLFRVGGHSWTINYYPSGRRIDSARYIAVFLSLVQSGAEPVQARAKFSLLDLAGKPVLSHVRTTRTHDFSTGYFGCTWFVKREWLEQSGHLKDDRFAIRCDVVVITGFCAEQRRAPSAPLVVVPPPNLHRHLGDLLASSEGADVTFQVAGETFRAHRSVLAARSPVFKAELLGAMKESSSTVVVRVDDMEAEVFGALLGFAYTDTLPEYPELTEQEQAAMAQHLLVAADRYDLERMKLICEERLCKHIDMGSVVDILMLAEQHQCLGLKKACFRFLNSSVNLNEVMACDNFVRLTGSYRSVLRELLSNVSGGVPLDGEGSDEPRTRRFSGRGLQRQIATGNSTSSSILYLIQGRRLKEVISNIAARISVYFGET